MKRIPILVTVITSLTIVLAACAAPTAVPATQAPTAVQTQSATAAENPTAYPPAETPTSGAYPAVEATPAGQVIASGDMIQFDLVPDQSEARYLVTEQLAGKDLPNDAVGSTKQVSGAVFITADGGIDAARSKFVIQAGSLTTDQSRRDGYVRQNILQIDQYPEIVFVPTAVSGLSNPLSATGEVSFILTGQLTIRDVTKEVTWQVTGSINGDTAKGTAKTAVKFADFNLSQPRVPIVLSVEDNIRLEMDITLQRAGK
jgi:polyisoprenoid-binding protein YceI